MSNKKLVIFVFLLCVAGTMAAQKLQEKFEYKVIYELSFALDSTELENRESEYMILYTGSELSLFSSRAKTLSHPLELRGNSGSTSRNALTKFHYELLKDRKDQKIYYTLKIPQVAQDWFYYEQPLRISDWDIQPETKDIKGYKAQKAITRFAGRDHVAWFTSEIPISEGPYKFNGLPGLILEIADTENEWNFDFISLKKMNRPENFKVNLKLYKKVEKQELMDIWYNYRRDPMGYAPNPNVTIAPDTHRKYIEAFTKMLKKENNPLELKEK